MQGGHEELEIEAQPEIRSRIRTIVEGNILTIDYDEDWKDWTGIRALSGDKIRFRLIMREIVGLSIAGVGNLDCPKIESENLDLAISDAVCLPSVWWKRSGFLSPFQALVPWALAGRTDRLMWRSAGAGSFKAPRLEAGVASVRLTGVGSATVWAKDVLNAHISGAGVIEYYGSPKIAQSNTGLGVLKFMGNR